MMLSRSRTAPVNSVRDIGRREKKAWWAWYAMCLFGTLLFAVIANGTVAHPFSVAFLLLVIVAGICIVRPVAGVFVVVFLVMLGDPLTSSWYPFTKNLSSAESILFVSNQMIFNPLEICLAALTLGWVLHMMARHQVRIEKGQLFAPLMAFTGFLLFGLVNGLARGGNSNAAFWELRALLYLPLIYVLLTNLFTKRRQYQALFWLIMIAVFINSIIALWYQSTLTAAEQAGSETLVAHGATLPMNAMIVLIAAAWMLKGGSQARRYLLPVLAIPAVIVYLESQRRAAVVALVAGLLMFAVFLFWTNRKKFWKIAPVALIFAALYTTAFWGDTTSMFGFPAQAIKSVVAPDEVSDRNQSSDQYRVFEKIDIVATIKSAKITGIGFGHPFLRPVPLPAINPFLLEPYMPHNSILWIWMKTGIAGFISMLFLFAKAMRTGARNALEVQRGDFAAVTFTSVAFVMMYAVFAYVDIAWDSQNVVFLAVAMAVIGSASRLQDEATRAARAVEETEDYEPRVVEVPRRARVASLAVRN